MFVARRAAGITANAEQPQSVMPYQQRWEELRAKGRKVREESSAIECLSAEEQREAEWASGARSTTREIGARTMHGGSC